jgi:hypothetical protein
LSRDRVSATPKRVSARRDRLLRVRRRNRGRRNPDRILRAGAIAARELLGTVRRVKSFAPIERLTRAVDDSRP